MFSWPAVFDHFWGGQLSKNGRRRGVLWWFQVTFGVDFDRFENRKDRGPVTLSRFSSVEKCGHTTGPNQACCPIRIANRVSRTSWISVSKLNKKRKPRTSWKERRGFLYSSTRRIISTVSASASACREAACLCRGAACHRPEERRGRRCCYCPFLSAAIRSGNR